MTLARRIRIVLVAAALTLPAAADDVYLTNGNVLEEVVARVEGDQVVVHLPGGALRLSATQVQRIDRADSVLTEYVRRRRELSTDRGAGAAGWLALATWARDHGLASGTREAARRAAALDPGLAGLEPLMASLGFVRDDGAGPWLLPEELMARRGYVRYGDSWITAGERAELLRAEAEEARRASEVRRERLQDETLVQLAAAVRAQAEAASAREEREVTGHRMGHPIPGWFVPVPVYVPVPVPAPGGPPEAAPPADPRHHGGSHRGGFTSRVPGSLGSAFIPGRLNPQAAPPPGRLDPH